jgi:peptidyl-prolyl cis-trans isomerase D
MFDAVRNNKRIVQVFLVLIALPFAFFGLESYVGNSGSGSDVATIGDIKISQQQFQEALRDQQERLRASMGQIDPKLFDNPEARKAILNDLVNQRLLLLEASKRRMVVSDEAVRQVIAGMEGFQVDGRFSKERYELALNGQGMTPAGFEARVRQDMTLQQLAGAVGQSSLMSKTVSDRILSLQTEQREVMEYRLAADGYLDKVKLDDAAVQKFYDENGKQFDLPEQAVAEYVVLSMDAINAQVSVSEAEIKAWYEGNKTRFQQPEERRASHILISAEKGDKAAAKAKAEDLLKQLAAAPASFAELARTHSQDPGSAAKGGDLGFFGRGMMVKPFEESAFSLKENELSGVVESDFGFHLIKVTAIRPGKEKPLAEVRAEIQNELKNAAAARKFAEAAEAFTNMVYEQSDSLQPVADNFKLTVSRTGWLGREAVAANGPIGNEKVLAALFSDDVVKNKRNSDVVEVAPNTLVAARIADYKPVARQPLESVKATIESMLKQQQAQTLAREAGEAKLAALKKGEDTLAWSSVKTVSRLDPRQIPQAAVPAVFRLDASKLPAYAGVELSGRGYALFKVTKVSAGETLDAARRQAMLGQLGNLAMQEEVQLYLDALRTRYKVEVNQTALMAK